jgi:hypothetical protein
MTGHGEMILAHAFGKRYDLPIPLYLFVIGGALVVIASFLLVVPRGGGHHVGEDNHTPEGSVDGAHLRGLHPVWGTLTTLWLAFVIWGGFVGSQEVAENIIVTWLWLIVWIAVPLTVAVVGDWTQPVNPFAFLAKIADSGRLRQLLLGSPEPVRWPDWLGWWPAVVLFFLGACGELIYNLDTTVPKTAAEILLSYAVFTLLMGLMFGRQWLRRGEVFTVLLDTWGRLGYFRFGAPGRRGFAGGLELGFARRISRVAFVLLMLLNVNFDGLLSTPQWQNDVLRRLPSPYDLPSASQHYFNTLAFAGLALSLAVILVVFAYSSAVAGQHRSTPLGSFTGLLPSLVPIAFGYLLAHNLEYVLVNGQLLFPLLGNPPGGNVWPLAPHMPFPFNDSYEVHSSFLPSGFYWYVSLVVIIAVHVYAVVIAHRHLVRIGATRRLELRSEYPWLAAMVGYTCLSLWLLAQPLTETTSTTSGGLGPPPALVPTMATVTAVRTTAASSTEPHRPPPRELMARADR